MKRSLQTILGIGLFGLLFSGYLSYQEIFVNPAGPTCPTVGRPGTVLGYPACVYGFFMYLAVVSIAVLGLLRSRTGKPRGAPGPEGPATREPPPARPDAARAFR